MTDTSRQNGVPIATGPGPGAGPDTDAVRAAITVARIILVASILAGQLWGLSVALDAYFNERMNIVWWLVAFEALSFVIAFAVWRSTPEDR